MKSLLTANMLVTKQDNWQNEYSAQNKKVDLNMLLDIRVTELLASKLCHDLISPVSAINNGVELIEDIGGSVVDEAMKLIGDSATQASRRLRLFRFAYGRAGSEENVPLREIKGVTEQAFSGGKVNLNWPETGLEAFAAIRGALKTLVNLVVMCEEILPYGGSIQISQYTNGVAAGCRIYLSGRNAQLTPVLVEALEGESKIEDLTPRTVQPYMVGRFAAAFNLHIDFHEVAADSLEFIVAPKAA